MASDQQVALTRISRAGSHLPRVARQVVPAFLQKLYEMVNDPANDDLIRWSDMGDSFYVLDHERFAREVLGRWFKHQNFASFVRQLNMYGFHKIPHLQQGVLRSESDTEFWNFEHPNFHRGQPDLLCLIQRKKQVAQAGEDAAAVLDPVRDSAHGHGNFVAGQAGNLSPGQILDINSIVNGIAAIKRHQTTISAELNQLKSSNEQLWQEALAARERHKKHQDTINRILKFLAGVFGNATGPVQLHKEDTNDLRSHAVIPRKSQRLMIAGGQQPLSAKHEAEAELVDEDASMADNFVRDESPEDRFATVETPLLVDSASVAPLDTVSLSTVESPYAPTATSEQGGGQSAPHYNSAPSASTYNPTNTVPPAPHVAAQNTTALTRNATPPPSHLLDGGVPSPFAQVLSNPAQLHRLLAALGSQGPTYPIPPDPPSHLHQPVPDSQLTTFEPQYGFDFDMNHQNLGPVLPSHSEDSLTHFAPLVESSERLEKTYENAAEINKDVDALHHSINSLIESLGLDPTLIAPPAHDPTSSVHNPTSSVHDPHANPPPTTTIDPLHDQNIPIGLGSDFDFDALWSQLGSTNGAGYLQPFAPDDSPVGRTVPVPDAPNISPEHFAFLDEAASVVSDDTASPVVETTLSPAVGRPSSVVPSAQKVNSSLSNLPAPPARATRKRKLDGALTPENSNNSNIAQASSGGGTRTKRKR